MSLYVNFRNREFFNLTLSSKLPFGTTNNEHQDTHKFISFYFEKLFTFYYDTHSIVYMKQEDSWQDDTMIWTANEIYRQR